MTIAQELSGLQASAKVVLYVLDASPIGGEVLRFHNGTNQLNQPVVWQGQTYQPFPIEAEGFEVRTQGPAARPKIRVADRFGLISVLLMQFGNLEGALLIRKVTHARFLDAVNFPGGVNPEANPDEAYPDDTWVVDRVSRDDATVIEWELASPLDLEGMTVPGRRCDQLVCSWRYRSADCGYTGGPVAKADDTPTADPGQDECSQLISGCKLRFGKLLPFGAFPGIGLNRQT